MGKNRVLTDALREVRNTRSRFFSLFLLSALAVAFLSGLRATAPDMKHSADCYFDEHRMMDLHILSTLGLTEEDAAAVDALPQTVETEGAYTVDAMVPLESGDMIVKTLSFRPGGLNQPRLIEGRMPERPDECLLDAALLTDSLQIGDTVYLDPGEDMEGAFRYDSYTIVGTAQSPLYISIDRGTTTLGAGRVGAFLLMLEDAYDLDYYTDLYATVAGAEALNAYSDEYDDLLERVTDELEGFGDDRADERYDEVVGEANEKLADAEQELKDAETEVAEELAKAEQELKDARKKLDDGWQEYYDGQNTLAAETADAEREIADGEAELRDAEAELEDARVELADARASLEDGEAEYESGRFDYQKGLADYELGKTQYSEGLKQYEDGLAQYRSGAAALASGQAQLRESAEKLNAAKALLDAQQASFEQLTALLRTALSAYGLSFESDDALFAALDDPAQSAVLSPTLDALLSQMSLAQPEAGIPADSAALLAAKQALDDGWEEYYDGLRQYEAGVQQLNAGGAQLNAAWSQLQDAKKELDEALAQLTDARTELDDAEAVMADARVELDDGWAEYYDGLQQYEDGLREYEEGKQELADARAELADAVADAQAELDDAYQELLDGEREYADGLREYEDGKREAEEELSDARKKLNDARRDLAEIEDCQWYILDRNTNVGFVTYGQDSAKMDGLADVFPLIFFLVAALVCLTTMTRMVEEQRVQIGGMKALGYGRGAIAFKYVGYGLFSGLIGGLAGLALGTTLIPYIIYTAWCIIYALPPITFLPQPGMAVLSVAAAVAVLTLSALAACLSTLTAVPAQLMRPKAPPIGRRVLLEHIPALWKRFSFNQKVTLRNLFRYKKRFIMTLVGIAGCTALIVTGFGLRDSIFEIMDIQYDELTHSNVSISVADDMTDDERQELLRILDRDEDVADYLLCTETAVTAETSRYSLALTVVSTEKAEDLTRFCTFRSRTTGDPVPFDGQSVLLSEKTANMLGVSVGDSITLVSGDDRYEVAITGIVEHYVQHYIYTTDRVYEQIFGTAPEGNSYWVSCPDNSEEAIDALASQLVNLAGVNNLTRITTLRETMMHSLETVDYAVIIIIISAAALAFVVLYNLTNINITERMRELATLKVLGFHDRELSAYVYRENIILTVLGAVIGLFLGKALLMYLIGTVEVDMVMFGRQIKPLSYLLGALLTGAFSLLVNLAAHRRLKGLDMVESLKTVE